jgi:hypothetical protein
VSNGLAPSSKGADESRMDRMKAERQFISITQRQNRRGMVSQFTGFLTIMLESAITRAALDNNALDQGTLHSNDYLGTLDFDYADLTSVSAGVLGGAS